MTTTSAAGVLVRVRARARPADAQRRRGRGAQCQAGRPRDPGHAVVGRSPVRAQPQANRRGQHRLCSTAWASSSSRGARRPRPRPSPTRAPASTRRRSRCTASTIHTRRCSRRRCRNVDITAEQTSQISAEEPGLQGEQRHRVAVLRLHAHRAVPRGSARHPLRARARSSRPCTTPSW